MIITKTSHTYRDRVRDAALVQPPDDLNLLDTVHLYAPADDFAWDGSIDGWVQVTKKELLKDDDRRVPEPTKVTAQYRDKATGWVVKFFGNGVRFEGSVRRLTKPFKENLLPLRSDDFSVVREYIDGVCKHLGLSLDPLSLRVARADFARDAIVPYHPSLLLTAVNKLSQFERLKLSSSPAKNYSRFENSRRALAFYHKQGADDAGADPHRIRAEVRLLKKAVAEDAGIYTLADLQRPKSGWELWRLHVEKLLAAAREGGLDFTTVPPMPTLSEVERLLSEPNLPIRELSRFIAGRYGLEEFYDEFAGEHGVNDFIATLPVHSERKRRARQELSRISEYRRAAGGPVPRNPWAALRTWHASLSEPYTIGNPVDSTGGRRRSLKEFRKSAERVGAPNKYSPGIDEANSSNDTTETNKEKPA